jgi:hypothetical protein
VGQVSKGVRKGRRLVESDKGERESVEQKKWDQVEVPGLAWSL